MKSELREQIQADYSNQYYLDLFIKAYIEAMYFVESEHSEQSLPLSDRATEAIKQDCRKFWEKAEPLVEQTIEKAYLPYDEQIKQAGHDFYFTRNGHGIGFWEKDKWPVEEIGEQLTELAEMFGEKEIWENVNGEIEHD